MHETILNELSNDSVSQKHLATLPTPRDEQIGLRLRRQRLHLGMSRSYLAHSLGIREVEVEAYEMGLNWIGTTNLFRISDILGVDMAFFYTDTPMDDLR